jgi:membrane associated rhomboid family serine protease
MVWHKKEWSRMISNALVHGGWIHLFINMYVLYMFGNTVEQAFKLPDFFPDTYKFGNYMFIAMYLLSIPFSSMISLLRHKNNHSYNAVGASGAISAVVFTYILIMPKAPMRIIFIPIDIPAYILGAGYLIYSYIMGQKSYDNIAHEAHFSGAIFGFTFPLILNINLIIDFFYQIIN